MNQYLEMKKRFRCSKKWSSNRSSRKYYYFSRHALPENKNCVRSAKYYKGAGVIPATIAVIDGKLKAGLT